MQLVVSARFLALLGMGLCGFMAQAADLQVSVTEFPGGPAAPAGLSLAAINIGTGQISTGTTTSAGSVRWTGLPDGQYYIRLTRADGTQRFYPAVEATTVGAIPSGAGLVTATNNAAGSASLAYQSQRPPVVTLWPASGTVGNPMHFAIKVDNGLRGLDQLDLSSLKLKFNGVEIPGLLLSQAARSYVLQSNSAVVLNFPNLALPPGSHSVEVSAGNRGLEVVSTTANLSVPTAKPYQIGFHTPPLEDYVQPLNDWERELTRVNTTVGRHHTLVGYFSSWKDANGNYTEYSSFLNDQIFATGAIPVITWEPWKAGGGVTQADFSLDNIAGGAHDAYLRRYAAGVKAAGKPFIFRIMHEFNGNYYPWGGPNNGNDPQKFINAFRHIVGIFREVGANNAQFMWSPNFASDDRTVPPASKAFHNFYPGDDVVDWLGVSGYNWGWGEGKTPNWVSFSDIFEGTNLGQSAPFLADMAQRYPSKKLIVAEIGTSNRLGDTSPTLKAQWIADAYQRLANHPVVGGVVWFNNTAVHNADQLEADFRVITAPGGETPAARGAVDASITEAYKQAVQ